MNTTTTRSLGKTLTLAGLIAASLLAAAGAQAAVPFNVKNIEIKPGLESIRGPLTVGRFAPDTGKAAKCPIGFHGSIESGKFECSKEVIQLSDVKCPSNFPNYVARTAPGTTQADRDLCAAPGRNIASEGSLANFQVGRDFIRVPLNGVHNGVSLVLTDPSATVASGWHLNLNANGVADRYRRVLEIFADPVLVQR